MKCEAEDWATLRLRWFMGGCCVAFCFAIMGCGSSHPMAQVSGVVTLDGKPLPNARIGFEPAAAGALETGPAAYGVTDENGYYQLETVDGWIGASVGLNRVWITTEVIKDLGNGQFKTTRRELLPSHYHSETTLTFDVPADGSETANFELTLR